MSTIKLDKSVQLAAPTLDTFDRAELVILFGNSMGTILLNGPDGAPIRIPVDISSFNADAFILAAIGGKYSVQATKVDPPAPVVEEPVILVTP